MTESNKKMRKRNRLKLTTLQKIHRPLFVFTYVPYEIWFVPVIVLYLLDYKTSALYTLIAFSLLVTLAELTRFIQPDSLEHHLHLKKRKKHHRIV